MNRSRRDRKRARELSAGRHTQADHSPGAIPEGKRTPGPVRCPVCRPAAKVRPVHGDGGGWRT